MFLFQVAGTSDLCLKRLHEMGCHEHWILCCHSVKFSKLMVSAGHWIFILRCSGIIPRSDLAENYSVHKSKPTAFPKLIRVEHTRPPFWETRLCSEYTHPAIILVMSLDVLQSTNCYHPRSWLLHLAQTEGTKYWWYLYKGRNKQYCEVILWWYNHLNEQDECAYHKFNGKYFTFVGWFACLKRTWPTCVPYMILLTNFDFLNRLLYIWYIYPYNVCLYILCTTFIWSVLWHIL